MSVVVVVLESDPKLSWSQGPLFAGLEITFSLLFSLEYLLRLLCSRHPLAYARSFFGVVRILRLLRVFRILKLGSYPREASLLRQALIASRRKILIFLLTMVTLVVIIGTLMYLIEGEAGGFRSIPVGIYWAIVTITTVGYGDVAPVTPLSRIVASVVMLLGYSIIAVTTGTSQPRSGPRPGACRRSRPTPMLQRPSPVRGAVNTRTPDRRATATAAARCRSDAIRAAWRSPDRPGGCRPASPPRGCRWDWSR